METLTVFLDFLQQKALDDPNYVDTYNIFIDALDVLPYHYPRLRNKEFMHILISKAGLKGNDLSYKSFRLLMYATPDYRKFMESGHWIDLGPYQKIMVFEKL